jgi:hypothetical protein
MRVSNEPGSGASGAFSELFRLQSDFQARLAEETLRYLRRLQGAVVPAAPGTVMMPAEGVELRAAAEPGGRAELAVEIENLQRVHCMVTPQLTPLVSATGVTWFPAAEMATSSRLVPPGGVERIEIPVAVPAELPAGEYRGALLLQGFRQSTIPVMIAIGTDPGAGPEGAQKTARKAGRKSATTKTAKKAVRKTPPSQTKKTSTKKTSTRKTSARKTAAKKTAAPAKQGQFASAAKRPGGRGRERR